MEGWSQTFPSYKWTYTNTQTDRQTNEQNWLCEEMRSVHPWTIDEWWSLSAATLSSRRHETSPCLCMLVTGTQTWLKSAVPVPRTEFELAASGAGREELSRSVRTYIVTGMLCVQCRALRPFLMTFVNTDGHGSVGVPAPVPREPSDILPVTLGVMGRSRNSTLKSPFIMKLRNV